MGSKMDEPCCPHCGSPDLLRDAWASWCPNEQDWVLHSTYDTYYCEHCACEVRNPRWNTSDGSEQQ
jgi:phage terminase large subunit GpA-like protein